MKIAFLKLQEAEARIRELEAARSEPIAIVGVGCRIPGAEEGPDAFWRLLRDQRCAVSDRVEQRLRGIVGPLQLPESSRHAALLESVDLFDPQHFGISPREAAAMDPQQRLLLEVSWEALEDAGIDPGSLYRSSTGVYVGIAANDYAVLQVKDGDLKKLHPHFASGTALSIASGRIAYTFGLHGPAVSVDTACSSSLVAVHLACQALRAQECSVALAGGVNLILTPEASVAFAQAGMTSSRGICSPFLNSADGFVRGEGCGIVVLKRLVDAKAAGDRMLAVIAASAINQDGPSSGLTAPSGSAQQALLQEAYRRAGVDLSAVGYVETHGTGTRLGDPIEAEALGAAFAGRSGKLAIGSVKANIGHLESAAGIAGLIKLVLSLEHKQIPGQIQHTDLNEHIRWHELPIELPAQARDWDPIGGRRIGGVSSFGLSGTNVHVVVEEWPKLERSVKNSEGPDVLCLSARTEAALREMAERYSHYLKEAPWGWNEICHTANTGRAALAERLAIVATNSNAAAEKLDEWLRSDVSKGIWRGHAHPSFRGPLQQSSGLEPDTLARLFVEGAGVDWSLPKAGRELRRAKLPTYPFQRERYWFEERRLDSAPAFNATLVSVHSAESVPQEQDIRLLTSSAPAEERLGIIRDYLRTQVAKVLGMESVSCLDQDKPLAELGMDSLMALELKNGLQQFSGMKLPANFAFEHPTIRDAAVYLNAIIGPTQGETATRGDAGEYEDIAL
ncbi:MAG TPA: beta-ketoacyl synthase N-terminal-like domain-containing protein [Terracidiphilus sp.]